MKKITGQSGLTLAEILVAVFIASMVGSLLLVIMANSTGLFLKESSKIGQGVGVNDALMLIRQDVKRANSVAASYTHGSTTYTSGANQLVLTLPSIDAGGNIIQNTYDYFVYLKDQNVLRLKSFPNPLSQRKESDRVLATYVALIFFQYYNSSTPPEEVSPNLAAKIKASLVLNQKAGSSEEQIIATSEANLRNN